jgi:integrase
VLAYVVPPEGYKLDHLEGEAGEEGRVVYIGPKAREVLDPLLIGLEPAEYVFSPARAVAAQNEARSATRKTPVYGKQSPDQRRKAKRAQWAPRRLPGERYITTSYRRAITKACKRAGVSAWNPNQLRHAAATYIAEHESLDAAQVVLGHRSIKTTLRYAPVRERKAIDAAKRRG